MLTSDPDLGSEAPTIRKVPGEEGLWIFIFGDMIAFTVIFATYLYYRGEQPELFEVGRRTLDESHGVINTLLLLLSSLFVAVGLRAVRQQERAAASWLFIGALVCAFAFVAMKFVDYGSIINGDYFATTGDFYVYYFALTGLHLFHLVIGVGVLFYLLSQALRIGRAPVGKISIIEGGAAYWHMVDLLWIVIFPLLYLVK